MNCLINEGFGGRIGFVCYLIPKYSFLNWTSNSTNFLNSSSIRSMAMANCN